MSFDHRIDRLLRRCIAETELDLRGLTVYTEAASGPYLHTPILAARAGAEEVIAVTRDSRFATAEDVRRRTEEAAAAWNVSPRLRIVEEKRPADVGAADIITNSGFVRPIDRSIVTWMKPTAVVPLMWETWEYRESDLDLSACRERGILVLGTHEGRPPVALYEYGGFFAMKLLFELGLEGHETRVVLLGGGAGLGRSIHSHFRAVGMDVSWFASSERDAKPYAHLAAHWQEAGSAYDVILVAEHADRRRLLGRDGILTYDAIRSVNPAVRIGVISGDIDREGLAQSGLRYAPEVLQPFGVMSYQAYELGPLPILRLFAGGLKVGEAMARARLRGLSLDAARDYALANAPAMAFDTNR